MEWIPVNLSEWNRAEHYYHYRENNPCVFSMTAELDITRLYTCLHQSGYKLYPVLIYGITRIVNQHPELRMGLDKDGNPGYYSHLNPTYTIFHPETEVFSSLWTTYHDNFFDFYRCYTQDQETYGNLPGFSPKPVQEENLLNISCIPWVRFSSFQLNIRSNYDYLLPIFTIGKYEVREGRRWLPLAMQVHHAACDGFHASRFYRELQEWMDGFSPV